MFYYQKKGIPSENPFLFRKELSIKEGKSIHKFSITYSEFSCWSIVDSRLSGRTPAWV